MRFRFLVKKGVTIGLLLAKVSAHGLGIAVLRERPVGPRRIGDTN